MTKFHQAAGWDEFIGIKKRTARTHYELERKCKRCDRFITDTNKSGYCFECMNSKRVVGTGAKGWSENESAEHKKLKEIAVAFLESQGCLDIRKERQVMGRDGRVIFDVAGKKDGKYVAVECGGSQDRKLTIVLAITREIFILPYGSTIPYKYEYCYKICNHCGTLIGVKS